MASLKDQRNMLYAQVYWTESTLNAYKTHVHIERDLWLVKGIGGDEILKNRHKCGETGKEI